MLGTSLLGACSSAAADPAAAGVAAALSARHRFPSLRGEIRSARAGGVAGARAGRGPISDGGLSALGQVVPHDIRRTDVPRWLSARAHFGEALTEYVDLLEAGQDARALEQLRVVEDALQGWSDAWNGVPTETAI